MCPQSHQECPCPVSPENIIGLRGCSLEAGGGIPVECRGFQERHAQLQKGWGRVFLKINQGLLNNHVRSGLRKKPGDISGKNTPVVQVQILPMARTANGPGPHHFCFPISSLSLHHAVPVTLPSSLFSYTLHRVLLPSFSTGLTSV